MDKSRLNQLCKEKKVTISEVEKSLNLSNGSLRKDGDIKSERLLALADYFNVSMEYLMGRDKNNSSSDKDIDFLNDFKSLDEESQRQLIMMLAFLKDQKDKK